jgi:hypothetical protein
MTQLYDLSNIPYAVLSESRFGVDWWDIVPLSQGKGFWQVVVDTQEGSARIRRLDINRDEWFVFSDRIYSDHTDDIPNISWLPDLQKLLEPWETGKGSKRITDYWGESQVDKLMEKFNEPFNPFED